MKASTIVCCQRHSAFIKAESVVHDKPVWTEAAKRGRIFKPSYSRRLNARHRHICTHIDSEVFEAFVLAEPALQFGIHVDVLSRILEECPELLQSIQLTCNQENSVFT
ncbi:hypothetical protein DPMN_068874 [Dreissena polymorpha]|uniref:Uncharacterized protein n=1 Tax=Dreissena polymorpha TaxID=45954 RepID=A0A9D4BMK4_DREPO|nr:hypothetical protein DPMN_068874 [Dreissena polymorpha]